eukprot:Hpha_TRINITY_DN15251_c0_g3::TRINITY_DN15251_c0_g3_i1::g.66610::m.66610
MRSVADRGPGVLRGCSLMVTKDALGTGVFFAVFDATRAVLSRLTRQRFGTVPRLDDLTVGDCVRDDQIGVGLVSYQSPSGVTVDYATSSRGTVVRWYSREEVESGTLLSEQSRRGHSLFSEQYVSPLLAGIFAGTCFVVVTHPFDRAREVDRALGRTRPPGVRTAASHLRRLKNRQIWKGLAWKLPNAVLVGLPLLAYSFAMYRRSP